MPVEIKNHYVIASDTSVDLMQQLEKALMEMHSSQDLAKALAYILTFHSAHKAGALTDAPPDYLEEIVQDVSEQLGVVTIARNADERAN